MRGSDALGPFLTYSPGSRLAQFLVMGYRGVRDYRWLVSRKHRRVQSAAAALSRTIQPIGDSRPSARGASDGMINYVAGLGTSRDKNFYNEYSAIGFGLTQYELDNMFRGSWIPRRIVTTVADDMTREWVSLSWDNYDNDINNAKTIESQVAAFNLRNKVNEAITWGRLYGGCVIVIGLRGDNLSTPLDMEKIKKGSLQHLTVLDRNRVAAGGQLDTDMNSPNFGLPLTYQVAESALIIHWTRVVRFDGQRLPYFGWSQNGYWHDSVLQAPLNAVRQYDSATGGVSSMMWEASVDIITVPGLATMASLKGGEAMVSARHQAPQLMKSFNRTLLLDGGDPADAQSKGETYQQKTITFAGITDIIRDFRVDLCGAADIPATRLFGQSPAGMTATGESDTRNYYDHVASRQETNLRPQLTKLYEVLIRSALGYMPENFSLAFNPLWQMSDTEQAAIEKTRAETDTLYLTAGVLSEGAVAAELFDRKTYRTMDEEDVLDAEALADEPDEPPAALPVEGEDPALGPDPDAEKTPKQKQLRPIGDAVGDVIKHEADGWHVYAGGKHHGGPYKTRLKAMRRARQMDRFDRR